MNEFGLRTPTRAWGVLGFFTALQILLISIVASSAIGQTEGVEPSSIGNAISNSIEAGSTNFAPDFQSGFQGAGSPVSPTGSAGTTQRFNPTGSANGFVDDTQMRFGLRVDIVNLSKTGLEDQEFVFDRDTIEPVLSYSDLDSGSATSARIRLTYQSDFGTGFELGFFDFDSFSGSTTVTNAIPLLFGGVPADPAPSYDISDESRLESFEANAWARRSQRLRLGLGFRHINFENEFDTIETGSNTGNSVGSGFFADTNNDLVGGQVMADVYFPLRSALQIEGGIRVGFFNNSIDVQFDSLNRDIQFDGDTFSTAIDWNAGVAWHINRNLIIRGGYQAIYISNLAAATDQSTGFDFFADSAPIRFSDVNFSGGYIGAEVRF